MEKQAQQYKCPFRHPIITRDYGCELSHEVTFREGPGITCANSDSWQRCTALFEGLKSAALPAFEVADDLTQMPASVISKIQYGGLAALASLLQVQQDSINNINDLVSRAIETCGAVDQLDYGNIVPKILHYRMRKRRRG